MVDHPVGRQGGGGEDRAEEDPIAEVAAEHTTLVIAHRLSTVVDADRILVMADGAVVERGTHADLMQHSGVYNRLIEIQNGYQKKQSGYDHIV